MKRTDDKNGAGFRWSFWLLLFLLAGLLAGCLQPSGPDDGRPGPAPAGDVRRQIADSLRGANRADCLQVYGIYEAVARYVESELFQAANSAELREQVQKLCQLAGWQPGKYPAFSSTFTQVTDSLLKENKTVLDRRGAIAELFHQIALGARDAAE